MNQVTLVGRVTKDLVLRQISQDRVQTSFVIAVARNFKNSKGEVGADFILCSLWGRLAENTVKHCGKGSLIGVSGRIQSRTYDREDQGRIYVTEVIGDSVQFISTKSRAKDNLYEASASLDEKKEAGVGEEAHFHLPKREDNELPIM